MRVALCQMRIAPGEPEANRAHAEELLAEAASRGARVAILPEMWNTGYRWRTLAEAADRDGEPTRTWAARVANRLGLSAILGSIADRRGGAVSNAFLAVTAAGEELVRYEKIHLFSPLGEPAHLRPGGAPGLFELDGHRFGAMICYDLRFPELARTLCLHGAECLVVPSEWPHPRLDHWRTLSRARAIENQAFLLACNTVGRKGEVEFCGHSLAVDPWGEVLAEGGEGEEVLVADLDWDRIERVRSAIPVWGDRRPDCYSSRLIERRMGAGSPCGGESDAEFTETGRRGGPGR